MKRMPDTPAPSDQSAQLEHGRMTSLINSMADGVIAVDEQVHVVIYNAAALNILDSNNSMQARPLVDFFQPIDENKLPIDIMALVQSTKVATINRDLRLKYSDGSIINLYLNIAPVHLGYGQAGAQGFVLIIRDITREKSLEEERDEFISVVSHELRTPIAISEGNISNAQLVAERSGDIVLIRQALAQAHEQILFLSEMINDLATLSRAERGTLEINVDAIDIPAMIGKLAAAYQPEAARKGIEIKTELAESLPVLHSSELYVREVLQNFVTNALKYSDKGAVVIAVNNSDKGVAFAVKDNGIGISKSDQERVFDKFFRSEDYRTRKTGGTGLGLYVTAKLARLLEAKLNLESELNEGSTFSITVPDLKSSSQQ